MLLRDVCDSATFEVFERGAAIGVDLRQVPIVSIDGDALKVAFVARLRSWGMNLTDAVRADSNREPVTNTSRTMSIRRVSATNGAAKNGFHHD